jgi:hypothetical protein
VNTTLITSEQATARGMRPLTTVYHLPDERWMLNGVLRDMWRGQIDCALVEVTGPRSKGVEVWRKPSKINAGYGGHRGLALEAR